MVMSSWPVYLTTTLLDRLTPLRGYVVYVHILLPEMDKRFSFFFHEVLCLGNAKDYIAKDNKNV